MPRPVLLVSLALAAPALAQAPAAPTAEGLFPLAVGNAWTYRVSGQDERFVVRAAREEMVGSQTCVRMEASLRDRVVATEHLAFTKDGLCRFREEREDLTPPVCVLKAPGVKFPRNGAVRYRIGTRTASATFQMLPAEEVTVPAGKFTATVVQAESGDPGGWSVRTRCWYAAGVGLVRQTVDEGKRPTLVLELEKFEPAK